MDEFQKKKQVPEEEKKIELLKLDAKKQHVVTVSIAAFLTFCCCAVFFFFLYRNEQFTAYIEKIGKILQPITIGIVLAYLLNPIVNTVESVTIPLLEKYTKSKKRAKSLGRLIGITGGWLFFIVIIVVLIASILPTITESIMSMVRNFPDEVNNLLAWIDNVIEDGSEFEGFVNEAIVNSSTLFEGWLKNTFLPKIEYYLSSIMSGAVAGVKIVLNIFN